MAPAIRRATTADAAALAAIGAETFTLTFGHLYRPEDLAAFLAESHAEAAYAKLLGDARYGLWLLEDDARPEGARAIGFAVAGPCGLPHPEVAGFAQHKATNPEGWIKAMGGMHGGMVKQDGSIDWATLFAATAPRK